jgi:hypothetical protein
MLRISRINAIEVAIKIIDAKTSCKFLKKEIILTLSISLFYHFQKRIDGSKYKLIMSPLLGIILLVFSIGFLLGIGLEKLWLVIGFFIILISYLHFFGGI